MLKISQVRWFQRQISLTSPPERLGMRRLRISNNCYRFSLHIALTGPSCHLLVKNATLKSTRDAELRSANIQLVNLSWQCSDTNQLLVDPKMFISGINHDTTMLVHPNLSDHLLTGRVYWSMNWKVVQEIAASPNLPVSSRPLCSIFQQSNAFKCLFSSKSHFKSLTLSKPLMNYC